MSPLREIAKFACGWEAFHAVAHAYFFSTGITLTVLGFTLTSNWNLLGAIVNAAISLLLGHYAWDLTTSGHPESPTSGKV